jgi:hypothetical protein
MRTTDGPLAAPKRADLYGVNAGLAGGRYPTAFYTPGTNPLSQGICGAGLRAR